jgi:DNA polymerase-3 subunit gamma/tau
MLAFQRETPPQVAASAPAREPEKSTHRVAPVHAAPVPPPVAALDWPTTIERLKLTGLLREFAANCVFVGYKDQRFDLIIPPGVQHLRSEKLESRLESLLRKELADNTLRLRVSVADPGSALSPAAAIALAEQKQMAAARAAIEQDPNVAALCESFDARIEAGSIAPHTRD